MSPVAVQNSSLPTIVKDILSAFILSLRLQCTFQDYYPGEEEIGLHVTFTARRGSGIYHLALPARDAEKCKGLYAYYLPLLYSFMEIKVILIF